MSEVPGMSEGIEAIRILFQGSEMLFRTTGSFTKWSMENLIKFGTFIFRLNKNKKDTLKPGEIQFSDLLKKGEVGIMQITNSDMENFIEYAKKAGLTYAIMPDLNKNDDYFEVAFLEKQGTAARYYIAQNPDTARSYTFVEYQNNANTEEIEKTLEKLDKDIQVQVDAMSYSDVMKQEGLSINLDSSFFILENVSESEKIKIGIPNEENRYIELSKKRLSKGEENKKILIAMLPDEEFNIVDKDGNPILSDNVPEKIKAKDFKHKSENIKVKRKKDPNVTQVKIVNRSKDGQVTTLVRDVKKRSQTLDKIATPVKMSKGKSR